MKEFSVDFVSPASFAFLAAEVSFQSQIVCRIDMERSDGTLQIEFFHEARLLDPTVSMKFPLSDFMRVIEQVRVDLRAARG